MSIPSNVRAEAWHRCDAGYGFPWTPHTVACCTSIDVFVGCVGARAGRSLRNSGGSSHDSWERRTGHGGIPTAPVIRQPQWTRSVHSVTAGRPRDVAPADVTLPRPAAL